MENRKFEGERKKEKRKNTSSFFLSVMIDATPTHATPPRGKASNNNLQ